MAGKKCYSIEALKMRPNSSFNQCTQSLRIRKLKYIDKICSRDKHTGSSLHHCMLLLCSHFLSNLIGQLLSNILGYNETGDSSQLSGFKKEPSIKYICTGKPHLGPSSPFVPTALIYLFLSGYFFTIKVLC